MRTASRKGIRVGLYPRMGLGNAEDGLSAFSPNKDGTTLYVYPQLLLQVVSIQILSQTYLIIGLMSHTLTVDMYRVRWCVARWARR